MTFSRGNDAFSAYLAGFEPVFTATTLTEIPSMRKFEQDESPFIVPIESIKINLKCRDDVPSLLLGLQHLRAKKPLREAVVALLEAQVLPASAGTRHG